MASSAYFVAEYKPPVPGAFGHLLWASFLGRGQEYFAPAPWKIIGKSEETSKCIPMDINNYSEKK